MNIVNKNLNLEEQDDSKNEVNLKEEKADESAPFFTCPECGGKLTESETIIKDLASPSSWRLIVCDNCKHRFINRSFN